MDFSAQKHVIFGVTGRQTLPPIFTVKEKLP